MSLVTTMIKPARLDDLRREPERIGISGMTVTEVRGLRERRIPSDSRSARPCAAAPARPV